MIAGDFRKPEPLILPDFLDKTEATDLHRQSQEAAAQEQSLNMQSAASEKSSHSGMSEEALGDESALPLQISSPAAAGQSEEQATLGIHDSSAMPQRLPCLDFLPLQRSAQSSVSDLEGSIAQSIVEEHLQTMQLEAENQASQVRGVEIREEASHDDSAQPISSELGEELSRVSKTQIEAAKAAEPQQADLSTAGGMSDTEDHRLASESAKPQDSSSGLAREKLLERQPGTKHEEAVEPLQSAAEDVFLAVLDKPKDPERALPPLPGLQQISLELPVLSSIELEKQQQEEYVSPQANLQPEQVQLPLQVVEFEETASPAEDLQKLAAEALNLEQGSTIPAEPSVLAAQPVSQIAAEAAPFKISQPTPAAAVEAAELLPQATTSHEKGKQAAAAASAPHLPENTEEAQAREVSSPISLPTATPISPPSGLSESGMLLFSGLEAVEGESRQMARPAAPEASAPQPQAKATAAATATQDADRPASLPQEIVPQPVIDHPLAEEPIKSKEPEGVHDVIHERQHSLIIIYDSCFNLQLCLLFCLARLKTSRDFDDCVSC